ncbi:MAG: general secretion pathway protein N [Paraglaciecola sp.]|jgi:general secretion pathway protein N
MKLILKWVLLVVVVYIFFLSVKLPASQVLSLIDLPSDLKISGVSGTIWNGRAQQLTAHGLPVEDLSWELDVLPLLWGTVSAKVNAGNIREIDKISFSGDLSFSASSLKAENFQSYLPTNLVISLMPLPFPVEAQGRFRMQLEELEYTQSCQMLIGKGQWLKAEVKGLDQNIILGNFDASLSCENGDVLLEVNEPNSFGLSAIARIANNLKYSIIGKFKPDPNLPREVQQAAQFIGKGKTDAQGYYPLEL